MNSVEIDRQLRPILRLKVGRPLTVDGRVLFDRGEIVNVRASKEGDGAVSVSQGSKRCIAQVAELVGSEVLA